MSSKTNGVTLLEFLKFAVIAGCATAITASLLVSDVLP